MWSKRVKTSESPTAEREPRQARSHPADKPHAEDYHADEKRAQKFAAGSQRNSQGSHQTSVSRDIQTNAGVALLKTVEEGGILRARLPFAAYFVYLRCNTCVGRLPCLVRRNPAMSACDESLLPAHTREN